MTADDEALRAESERIERAVVRALSAAALLVPMSDMDYFFDFARTATIRRLEEKGAEPINDVDGHFRNLAAVYLMHVTQTGKVLH